jgi:chromosome segregation ATPase
MANDANLHKEHMILESELKLILQRLEQLSKDQQSGFSEIKHRISAIEGDLRSNAVWMGKTEQRLEHIEEKVQDSSASENSATISKLALAAMAALSAAIGVIGALATQGGI